MLSEYYLVIKSIHVHAVALSLLLFTARGLWSFWNPQALHKRWVKMLPHLVDTVLLASALTLAYLSTQYPGKDGWLTAKVAGLLIYIVLGTVALKRGRTRRIRVLAFLGALATFAYIVSVAFTRNPNPWF